MILQFQFQDISLCRIHLKAENKEAADNGAIVHESQRRHVQAASSMLFDQVHGVKAYDTSDDILDVATFWTELEIASHLVPRPRFVHGHSTCIISSISDDGWLINFDILEWLDSVILAPPSSPTSVPHRSQHIEVPMSSDDGGDTNVSEWVAAILADGENVFALGLL